MQKWRSASHTFAVFLFELSTSKFPHQLMVISTRPMVLSIKFKLTITKWISLIHISSFTTNPSIQIFTYIEHVSKLTCPKPYKPTIFRVYLISINSNFILWDNQEPWKHSNFILVFISHVQFTGKSCQLFFYTPQKLTTCLHLHLH